MRPFLFSLLASLLTIAEPWVLPQRNVGVIEGIVTRFGTTDGLSAVRITITRKDQQELEFEPEAITDATGRYIIRNAAPGEYTIRAALPAYIPPMKDGVPLEEGGATRLITVDIERPLTVNFSLTPGSVLAGRVLDPLGRPAEGATVEANLVGDSPAGIRFNGTVQADDRGQYRLYGLAPGRYRVSVDFRNPFGPQPLYIPESWVRTYFPGTPDLSRAALVEVGNGGVVEGLDFGFQVGQAFKISGTVTDPGRDKRSGVPDFYLLPLDSGANNKVNEAPRMAQNVAQQGGPGRTPGSFEIRGIRQGRYILYAEDWQVGPNMHDNFVVAQVLLDVTSDINDISLVMSGTSIVQGVARNAQQQPARNSRVVLIPPEDRRGHPMFYKEAKTDSSGKFTIKGVMPGDYKIFAMDPADFKDSPVPASMYSLPAFLEPYEAQAAAVRGGPDERVDVSVTTIRKAP